MTQRRRSSGRGRSFSPRAPAKYTWITAEFIGTVAVAAQDEFDCLTTLRSQLGANAIPGVTVTRILGVWGYFDNSPTVDVIYDLRGAFITGNVNNAASTPAPFIDVNNFMYVKTLLRVYGNTAPDDLTVQHDFDVRVGRKLKQIDDTLWFVVNNAGSGTPDNWFIRMRILLRLP